MPARPCYALVLCAGFGSRMGPLSRSLAKPLWPIFGNTILGHILDQLLEKSFEKIYVNTHHLEPQVRLYLNENYPMVEVLSESPLLDSGGAIVNCAQAIGEKTGKLYTFNGDNIIDLATLTLDDETENCTLYSEEVSFESHYNRLLIQEGRLVEIIKGSDGRRKESNITYAGISIFNLAYPKLWQTIKPIGIFKDMLDFKIDQVKVIPYHGKQIDLGEIKLYYSGLMGLVQNLATTDEADWRGFLTKFCHFKAGLLDAPSLSYHAPRASRTLNFSGQLYQGECQNALIFSPMTAGTVENGHIYWKGQHYNIDQQA